MESKHTPFDLSEQPPYLCAMTAVEERRIKNLLKTAVVEVLEERQDLLRDALQESLEDMAMLKAIQAGEKSRTVSRKKILQRLAAVA